MAIPYFWVMKTVLQCLVIAGACTALISCSQPDAVSNDTNIPTMHPYEPQPYVQIQHSEWSRNATIYEVNVRQYTPEGTFKAFSAHLPRLKAMGIDILWLMPIHPIGELNRKGSLGSYYAVKDYYAVNPEFGTMDDFKELLQQAHDMGMHVIIDWVANHSAWDNPLATQHPEWYTHDANGNFQPTPWYDWEDIIDFDYNHPGLREYMTKAMRFWVEEIGIDGYRCDVAGFIPVDFWNNVRKELDAVKPVFMLAEWESRDLHAHAFDMTYAWSLWDILHSICINGESPLQLERYMAHDVNSFPYDAYRMTFTDNHDKNSWEGNMYSNFGNGLEAAIVMCATINGMPLVYSGQEAGLNRSLAFFEKDLIDWSNLPYEKLYRKLFDLKHRNHALWNGHFGGEMIRIVTDHPAEIVGYYREKENDKVITLINFSNHPVAFQLQEGITAGSYTDLIKETETNLQLNSTLELPAWGYAVYHQTTH